MAVKPRVPSGMRDFTAGEVRQREWVIGRIRSVFERFGFEPIETPSLELFETLKGKLGEEGEQLLFKVLRRGTELEQLRLGRVPAVTITDYDEVVDCALLYDLTVPFSRFLAMHPELPLPFKRYQIQPVWRADRPQRGRYREFFQCDIDTAGTPSMLADAEVIAVVMEVLLDLGFSEFQTRIGHRKLLDGLVEAAGGSGHFRAISVAIDKLDKIGLAGVREEMAKSGVPGDVADKVLQTIGLDGGDDLLALLDRQLAGTRLGPAGVSETRELFAFLRALGAPTGRYRLDLSLARGLDYYTGPVHESIVTRPAIGSLTGGGRYDGLIGRFTGTEVPATGTSLGLERIIDVMKEFHMLPESGSATMVLVTIFDPSTTEAALQLASELRRAGIATEVPLKPAKGLKPQIAYASGKGIPLLAILGPDEIASGTVTLRAGPGNQKRVARQDAAGEIRAFGVNRPSPEERKE